MENKYATKTSKGFKVINFYGDNWKFKEMGINMNDNNSEDVKRLIEDNKIDKNK